jgi:hypothetical protein
MDSLPKDYLQKEYELRVAYLKDHLSRMWTRFNFFLTINTGLFAATLTLDQRSKYLVLPVCILGIVVSVCWNQFAATDNYLVDVYRRQVTHAHFLLIQDASFEALRAAPLPYELNAWTYTGATAAKYFDPTDRQVKQIRQGFLQRRIPWLSATELGVVISVLYALAWLALLIVTR